jgi:hypothetical protein
MRALIVNIEFTAVYSSVSRFLENYAECLRHVDGLTETAWLRDGNRYTLYQVFETSQQARRYLTSPLLASLSSHPACADLYTQVFEIDARLNAASAPAEPVPGILQIA